MRSFSLYCSLLFSTSSTHSPRKPSRHRPDADTKEPVPFVNIGITRSMTGTRSNENGQYQLRIPSKPHARAKPTPKERKGSTRFPCPPWHWTPAIPPARDRMATPSTASCRRQTYSRKGRYGAVFQNLSCLSYASVLGERTSTISRGL